MDSLGLPRFPSDGWRKTAVVNTIIVGLFVIANFSTLIWSISKSGVLGTNVFSQGDCDEISRLNTFLHLLLNIASSLIIASSNFFMQVLNSPTRAEVDRAHARQHWLDIGVPSLRNVLNVSPYKSLAWALFSLSSLPIHLLFNSSVFTVDYNGSEWSMALVSESLLHGEPYAIPGAALMLEGTKCYGQKYYDGLRQAYYYSYEFGRNDVGFQHNPERLNGVMADLVANATHKLSVSECKSEYQTCQGLYKYRNLLLVVGSRDEPTDSQGWVINDIYDMEQSVGDLYDLGALELDDDELQNETFSALWKPFFEDETMSQPNSLWFSSACRKIAAPVSASSISYGCYNSCSGPLGTASSKIEQRINLTQARSSNWDFSWLQGQILDNTTLGLVAPEEFPDSCQGIPRPSYRKNSTNNIHVEYCLAEPFEQGCKLAISNILLLVVTICVSMKLVLCVIVVVALRDDPLVTPGDAVASFIILPDPTTVGRCAAEISDIRICPCEQKPLRWQRRSKRLLHSISPANWGTNYFFFSILIIILATVMYGAFYQYPLSEVSGIGIIFSHEQSMLRGGVLKEDWFPTGDFLASVLLPNTPQLLLSCAYFAYNSLYTQLLTESEWQSFSLAYRPLRVTNPQGEQWSTFRLQLPYKYSIPLLVISIFLHWITSNAIFLFMSEGGYYSGLIDSYDDQVTLVGYSSPAILIGFIVSLLLLALPVLLALRRLRGHMPISRSNSLIISAACHVSICRKVHSASSMYIPMSWETESLNCLTESVGDGDDWGRRTLAAMSSAMEAGIELHPLLPRSCEQSAVSSHSTAQLQEAGLRHSADSVGNERTGDNSKVADTTGALEGSHHDEEQRLFSSQPSPGITIYENPDVSRIGNAALSNSTYTGQNVVAEGDTDMESERLVIPNHASGDYARIKGSNLDIDEADDRMQAARRLEYGSEAEEDDMQFRIRISRSRILWGVVPMPEEFYSQFEQQENGIELGHLTFGVKEQGVAPPESGLDHLYA